jgi:DNA replication protein DnaC
MKYHSMQNEGTCMRVALFGVLTEAAMSPFGRVAARAIAEEIMMRMMMMVDWWIIEFLKGKKKRKKKRKKKK